MRFQICDPRRVLAGAVRPQLVNGSETVFHDEQRLLIALIQDIQRIAQALRVNGPSPFRRLGVGIFHRVRAAGFHPFRYVHIRLGIDRIGHIVGKSDIVHGALRQDLLILRLHPDLIALPLQQLFRVSRIMSPAVDIGEEITHVHFLHRQHHIRRTAGKRIDGHHGNHAADLEIRIDLMPQLHRTGGRHQLMMCRLIHGLLRFLILRKNHAGIGPSVNVVLIVHLVVDLIEGHPVFHFIFIPFEADLCKPHKEINDPAVHPAAVRLRQMQRHLEMT